MSRRVLINGAVYEADDDALAELGKRGIDFSAAPDLEPQAGPHADEMPRLASEDTAPPRAPDEIQVTPRDETPEPGLWDRLMSGGADAATLAKVREAQPVNGTTGLVKNVASLMAPPILKGAGVLGRMGAAAVNQGVGGAASGALGAALEDKDPLAGGGWGAALGMLTGGAGELVGSAVEGAGKLAGGIADRTRVAAAGLDANTRKELAKKFGVTDLPRNLAEMIERVTPSPRGGQSALTRAETLASRLDEVGPKIDQTLMDAGELGLNSRIPESWQALQNKMSSGAGAAQTRAVTGGESAMGDALERQAAKLANQPAPADLVGLRQRNTAWGKDAYGEGLNINDRASTRAAGDLRDAGEATLDDIMAAAPSEIGQAFHGYNKDFGEAAMLERAARTRAAVEAGETKMPGAVASVAAGVANGVPGLVSGAASGTRNLLTQALGGTRGLDVMANGLRAAEAPLQQAGPVVRGGINGAGAISRRVAAALAGQELTDEERRRLEEEEANR